jgi:hypothetical protein
MSSCWQKPNSGPSNACVWDDGSAESRASTSNVSYEKDETDAPACIANALKRMSLQERDVVYHEVHGVADIIDEVPPFVEMCLRQFQQELFKFKYDPYMASHAIKLAETRSPDFVHNPKHCLKFLRAERFNPKSAAARMIRFFDLKMVLFGASKLCKDITLEDFSLSDLEDFGKGFVQTLPWRDRTGRPVVILFPSHHYYKSTESLVSTRCRIHNEFLTSRVIHLQLRLLLQGRMFYYIVMSLIEDEESQKKGIVIINYDMGDFSFDQFDRFGLQISARSLLDTPMKMVSMHHCFSDGRFRFIVKFVLNLLGLDMQARVKLHQGTFRQFDAI